MAVEASSIWWISVPRVERGPAQLDDARSFGSAGALAKFAVFAFKAAVSSPGREHSTTGDRLATCAEPS